MIERDYSVVIEATEEPDFFGPYSPDFEGFTRIAHSVEDRFYPAKWGMKEHVPISEEQGLPVPPKTPSPRTIVQIQQDA